MPEAGRALQGPWARGKAAGLRFRETGTQGQGKNRGEERESAEQWEHRDAWGGQAGTTGGGHRGTPFPSRWVGQDGNLRAAPLRALAGVNLCKQQSRSSPAPAGSSNPVRGWAAVAQAAN